ncbi:MAG: apolipoprotein N-acyltransferase [Candidatus Omnitrophica bacterium CG08_land_8_20_14_0_20_41_16]|uniref:Apolipoprotein N-acyltransferase n=1 Tax=Candidatus Sherwoodlollariibacterium unditelluris TaxID=1974757 RepID=A0A2G9YJM8_9BACT|nr:MAG: apolipoprotein N-acyltransferase [Candidatus Omnitrophica bacterium CG23_combo_of_CG06-09_8_20_14_all_41_10]PIS34370.1 MAG: apolipoprotein N-acyltransferase [Candidatus Omnitrophica bacterium CG08_land_8_20_14_0_20_41_16]
MLRKIRAHIAYRISHIAKGLSLCLLSALLLIFSFPNSNLWLFAWFGFVPLFFALRDKSKIQAFLLAYFTGVIFWLGIIYWLIHVTFIGMVILALYLALYFGVFGLIAHCYALYLPGRQAPQNMTGEAGAIRYTLILPSVWVILEYIRSHLFTGFPWALLGYSQYLNLPVIQIADITGAWGVSFLIMMGNVTLYGLIINFRLPFTVYRLPFSRGEDKRYTVHKTRSLAISLFALTFVLAYGYYRLHATRYTVNGTRIKISIIQGNILQELKWDMRARDLIMQKYFELTSKAAKDNPDLIIWPEAALPVVLEDEPAYYLRLCDYIKTLNKPLLFGSVTLRQDLYYNSALLLSGEAKLLNQYDKLHLVPFGEYVPFRDILKFLDTIAPIGDIAKGKDYTIFGFPVNFGVLICFEDVFPGLARNFVTRGAKFLVNITNDAWFGKTSEAYQHLSASVFRAVENRIYLVRCANTGVSAFISPLGKITAWVNDSKGNNIFVSGYRTETMSISYDKPSFYNRYGDIFPACCLFVVLYATISKVYKKKEV